MALEKSIVQSRQRVQLPGFYQQQRKPHDSQTTIHVCVLDWYPWYNYAIKFLWLSVDI